MKIITAPTVETIAVTSWIGHPEYQIPAWGDGAEALGAFAAKGCYDSFGTKGRSCRENQEECIRNRHGSVLEHFNITFFIEGISRACSHEIVRHRAGFGYSQRSTRYTQEEDAAIVLEPYLAEIWTRCLAGDDISALESDLIMGHVGAAGLAVERYQQQVKELMMLNPTKLEGFALRKWARGKARNVLPHNLETRMTMTGNIRAWRHFIEQRSERFAEAEIRRLAVAIFARLIIHAPALFADYTSFLWGRLP